MVMLSAGLATPSIAPAAWQGAQPDAARALELDFSALRMPLAPFPGDISFYADRAWTWDEGATKRLVLERDVRVSLGQTTFEASRAVVWLSRLPEEQAGEPVYQVFAYLLRVRTPQADASIGIEADALPVRGVIVGRPHLKVDLRLDGPPGSGGLVKPERATLDAIQAAQAELVRAFELEHPPPEPPPVRPPKPERPRPEQPPVQPPVQPPTPPVDLKPTETTPPEPKPSEPGPVEPKPLQPGPGQPPAPVEPSPDLPAAPSPVAAALFQPQGAFYVAAGDRVVVQSGEFDTAVIITGGVVVQYESEGQTLEISAERGVVFLKPGRMVDRLTSFSPDDVFGLYLEGEVRAVNGTYTFRAPRIYYDVQGDRALALDAVFWTYDQRLGMPLYMRADAIRQEAVNQFSAKKATLSNTAFFHPDFSIGITSVTVEQAQRSDGSNHLIMDARNITLKAGAVPFFWWPRYHGDPERIPIRSVGYQDSNRTGGVIRTTWDAYTLLGIQPLRDINALLEVDTYFDRGLGLGLDSDWSGDHSEGALYAYALPDDTGEDVMPRGTRIDRDGEARGLVLFRHRAELRDGWTILAEASYASDEAFVPALFPDIAEESRDLTTRLYARRTDENSQFNFEARGGLNDFIIPQHQLQAPGYLVDKLPQIGYISIANDLLSENSPGLLSYTWEASYAQIRLRFSEVDAADLGFNRDFIAQRVFGTNADESLGDLYRSLGLDEGTVNRFDTRHELSAQLKAGELLITPFATGRFTYYDDAFDDFSPDEDDQARFWGGAGVTLATSFHRINRDAESDLLDIHELHHIIEPSITLFHADTTIHQSDLPVYDDEVESLNDGSAVQMRLGQRWQTKRGGPGRWRSVDLLELNLDYVWHSDDTEPETPIGRFYAARPELSVPGEYLRLESILQLTEAVALAGETIYDLEIEQQARSSIGVLFEHTPDFFTTLELRYVNSQDVTYGRYGFRYTLTEKYRIAGNATYDFDNADFQTLSINFLRRFTIGELGVVVVYNNVRGETGLGFTFTPVGVSGRRIGGGVSRSTGASDGFGG
ncbi:MAG: LPS-assembly protein LptD [Leptolyngbya sp. PLA3]|nr:MAG: LPS-assembly protein LptD [Cyanobacteria bacterium CYA]MCE7968775.1 LPS-assembly protein LptD [Leptolyngbya sp. PL-A3]